MKRTCAGSIWTTIALGTFAFSVQAKTPRPTDPLCAPLKTFVASVKADEERALEFETSWFAPSTGAGAGVGTIEKTCTHGDYEPAKPACAALVKYGSIEFAGSNAIRVVQCLSPQTQFASTMQLRHISVDFSVGSEQRGQLVSIELEKKGTMGRDLMRIDVSGY